MARDVVHDIVDHTGEVAYRYRLWPEFAYEYISESVIDLIGYSAEELLADPALPGKIVHPDDAALMRSVLDKPAARSWTSSCAGCDATVASFTPTSAAW